MPEPKGYTAAEAAKVLGITRQYVYLLLKQHDPKTGRTVLEKYIPTDVAGYTGARVTAESVERFKQQREE